jgi:Ran GTPase-activating protein (RanGAP) involved in mRNA processing and transport
MHIKQTLTTLDLGINRLDLLGVQYLANALQQNKVTLTTLYLYGNGMDYQAAEHIANALQYNTVTSSYFLTLLSWDYVVYIDTHIA